MKKILYIGRIATYKGVHNVIKAMPKIARVNPDAKLLIRGQISTGRLGDYHRKLSTLIKNSPVKNKIKYSPGWIPESEKKKLVEEVDAIVCPSLCSEGFGIIPIEALGSNGILVSSDLFAETGVVNDEVAFVYPRNSVKDLSKQITTALNLSPQQKKEQKKKAKTWASNFTWDRHIDELEKVFKSLI